mmetsp:Transcript_6142/g.13259  ORF Transcript_6142/g.13259 Transcript_6142/m.13259 type:complete len:629 (-) Transcript_6142:14-1900(-)
MAGDSVGKSHLELLKASALDERYVLVLDSGRKLEHYLNTAFKFRAAIAVDMADSALNRDRIFVRMMRFVHFCATVIHKHPGRFAVHLRDDVQVLHRASLDYMDKLEGLKLAILRDPQLLPIVDEPVFQSPSTLPGPGPVASAQDENALEFTRGIRSATMAHDSFGVDRQDSRTRRSISMALCDRFLRDALPRLAVGMAVGAWVSGSGAHIDSLVSDSTASASVPMSSVLADLPPPPAHQSCVGCIVAWPTQVHFQTLGRSEAQQFLDGCSAPTELDQGKKALVQKHSVILWNQAGLREAANQLLDTLQLGFDAAAKAIEAASVLAVGTVLVLTVVVGFGAEPTSAMVVFVPGSTQHHVICCRSPIEACGVILASELRKLPIDCLPVVSSMPALQEQFEVQGTSGDGDCALHAILGRERSDGKWFLNDCEKVRREIQLLAVDSAGEIADRLRRSPDSRDAAQLSGLGWWFLMQDGGDVVSSADIRDAVLAAAGNIGKPGAWLQVPEIVVVSFCCKVKIVILNPPEWACEGAFVVDPGDCRSCVYLHNFGNWHWERTRRRDINVTDDFLAQMALHTQRFQGFTVLCMGDGLVGPRAVALQLSEYGQLYMRRPTGQPKHELCVSRSVTIAG